MQAENPILEVNGLTKHYGGMRGCTGVNLDVFPAEVIAIVGESGSGKTTLLDCISGRTVPDSGTVWFDTRDGIRTDFWRLSEADRRAISRTDLGYVHQNPRDGLRMAASAGANIGERLMAVGARHYGQIRQIAAEWMSRVELDVFRIDEPPSRFSGGMQQRLQIARNLVSHPRLIFMDEPTSGLDVSVQAKLLDLLRRLAAEIRLAVVIVTHDLSVARLLSQRIVVMQRGCVVECGLTDQVLDDPQHAYTQLLVSSALQ
jgi:putative phosphonate transport system ATP-binding protein